MTKNYCHLIGWLYRPVHMRNISFSKIATFLDFIYLIEFSENQDKEFQLGPMLFRLVKLGTI